jgi:hypothetical protein
MVYSRKNRTVMNKSHIVGGAYNEIKIEKEIEDKIKNKNQTVINIPTKNETDEKLKTFVNFKFK